MMFFKAMMHEANRNDQDIFVEDGRELVHWINLVGTARGTTAEKGREGFWRV